MMRGRGWILALVMGLVGLLGQPLLHPEAAHAAGGNTWFVAAGNPDPAQCPAGSNTPSTAFGTIAFTLTCSASDNAPADNPDTVQIATNTGAVPAYAGGFTVSQNVNLAGAGAASTTISGGATAVTVAQGSTVSISGLTISGAGGQQSNGGGIHNLGTLTVASTSIAGNTANFGGGIDNDVSGTLTITNSTVGGDTAAKQNYAYQGGGIENQGSLTVMQSTISGNRSGYLGGGVYNTNLGTATIKQSTISGNSAISLGGGAYNGNILYLLNSAVVGNTNTPDGAGLSNAGVSMTVVNSTISGNQTGDSGSGGGIFSFNGYPVNLINDTVSGNSSTLYGGGIYGSGSNTYTLSNTIVAGNTALVGPDCYGSLNDSPGPHGSNILGNNTSCTGMTDGANGDQVGSAPPNNIDPKLAPLTNYGGPTQTVGLLPTSPAVKHGDNSVCQSSGASGVNGLDQRGFQRRSQAAGGCDVGAYDTAEPSAMVITAPATADAGTPISLTVSLQNPDGSTATDYTGTVHLTSTVAGDTLPADYTFTAQDAGSHTFSLTFTASGDRTITASDGELSKSVHLTVNPGPAASLALSPSTATPTAGSSFTLTVTAQDAGGNTAAAYRGTVHFTSSDPKPSLPADYTFTAGDAGTHTFSVTLNTRGSQTVTATDTTTPSITGTAPVQVAPLTVGVTLATGYQLIGGDLAILPDATVSWTWNALSGQWFHPTGSEAAGTGAWENLSTGGSEHISVDICSGSVSVSVAPHRWNMVGNPCSKTVQLPAGTRALLWNGARYTVSPTIPAGLAAWVMPNGSPLTLTLVP